MLKIKICGITNLADALSAAKLGVDFLGFIFYKKSPRYISPKKAKRIIQKLSPDIKKVGVFVNEDIEKVKRIAKYLKLDFLQFHGEESPNYVLRFSAKGSAEGRPAFGWRSASGGKGYKIIKAFRIKDKEIIKRIPKYNTDLYLLDTYVKRKRGGTGETFNWNLAVKAKSFKKPIILSGGLNPKNIVRAIKKVRPYAIDVSSGIERILGKKDLRLMAEFIKKVRYAASLYCSL